MFLPPKTQKGKDFPAPSLQNPTPLAPMALSLSLSLTKSNRRTLSNPSFFHLFSSSSSSSSSTPPNDQDDPGTAQPQFSSFLSDVRASLTNQQQTPLNRNLQNRSDSPPLRRLTFSNSNTNPGKFDSVEDIKKKLTEYRNRSPVPPPTDASNSAPRQQYNHVAFRELMDKQERGGGDSANSGSGNKIQFGPIRESLQRLRGNVAANNSGRNENRRDENGLPVSPIRFNLGNENPSVMGRTGGVSTPLFGKESGGDAIMSTGFLRQYNHDELGERLRRLRPQEAKDGRTKLWFSIGELSERLRKLRELDEKEEQSRTSNIAFGKEIREGLLSAKISIDEKAMKKPMPRLNLFALGAPHFMLEPPQEHLVEKYFHPDNMTSSEKMKHELAKVRDEFKMSESDCGSARVQVAQLTTKIKHLSSVLHKKDKHSRKGLIGMVQQRKKLLKYLRRTDWDSYCFVLSKLGLRDNPDYKARQ